MRSPNVHPDRKAAGAPCIRYRYRQASQIIALVVAALGLLVFCGWAFHLPSLTYIRPTFASMKVNTALSFLFLGLGLWLAQNDRWQRSRRILGLLVVIIAAATLVEYAFHLNLGIDELFFSDTRAPSLSAYPGRMAIATAVCFVLLGLAVAFLGVKKALRLQHALVAPCFVFSLVALCGYLYGVKSLYAITAFSTMALHTAGGLLAACLSYFLARPDEGIVSIAASDSNSGLLLRRLVPAIIAVPILIGWLRLAGERANLYDTPFGIVLQVLGSVGCLIVLTMLAIRSMHRDEVARGQVAEALKESEEKFRGLFRDAGVGMVIVSSEGRFLAANRTFCNYFGYTEEELRAKTVESITFPEDWPAFSQKLSEALTQGRGFQWFQKRCLHKSGRIVYTETSASVIRDREEHPPYFVGAVLDITERKEAAGVLSGMTRKLVEAQEQERARIARELHDDITQRLALLAIDMELGQQQTPDMPSEVREWVSELSERAKEISDDIQSLSHELHSSNLEYLGIVGGMRGWCNEFGKRQEMEVEFKSSGLRNSPPREISLCLFRVLQEALHNAAKHSEVKRSEVQLREEPGEIHLIVSDLGKGFDASAMQGPGLGITSMQERVRLVGGTIVIDSEPLAGTTIHVRVPLGPEYDSQRAAG